MKKLSGFILMALIFTACKKNDSQTEQFQDEQTTGTTAQRNCATDLVLQDELAADPTLKNRMNEIEAFTQNFVSKKENLRLVDGVIEIPIVVHVIYKLASENISLAQIQSQIDILNEDFNNTNADGVTVPAEFQDEQTSVGIRFVLDSVIRKYSSKIWRYNSDMKFASKGGSNVVDPAHKLNLWVVNKINNGSSYVFGFGQYPGGSPSTDGIVIGHLYVGRTGVVQAPYDKGRTATHEVGHYLNLRHIWGDASCGDDLVGDTPKHNAANYGCPTYPHMSTCVGTPVEMTVNYMDYTDDGCMVMFTNQQKSRMLAVFAPGGPRAVMAQ